MNNVQTPSSFAILTEAPVEMTYSNARAIEAQEKANGISVCRIAVGRFNGHHPDSGIRIKPGKSLLVVEGRTVPVTLYYTSGGFLVEHEQAYGRYVTSPYHASLEPVVELLTRLGLQPYSFLEDGIERDSQGTWNGYTLLGLAAAPADVQRVLRLRAYRYAHVH
jgi:hypothetical protein